MTDQPSSAPLAEFFKRFISEYGQAWDKNDLQALVDFYHTPCFIYKSGMVYAHLNEVDKTNYFRELLEGYHKEVARAEIPNYEVKRLGDNSALVSVEWVCKRLDESVVFDYWDSYLLIHIEGRWKILGDSVHDPAGDWS